MSDQQDPKQAALPSGKFICPGCFSEKGPAAVCQHCRHDAEAPGPEDALKVQSTLKDGRYRVGKLVDASSRPVTSYLALDQKLGKRCFLEEYFPKGTAIRNPLDRSVAAAPKQGDDFQFGLDRFFQESRRLSGIRHPRLLSVLDHFAARGTAYRVTDYFGGSDLEHSLDWVGGRFGEREAAAIMIRILEGLHELHRGGVLHTDIRPAKIKLVRCADPHRLDEFLKALQHLKGRRPLLFGYASAQLALQGRLQKLGDALAAGYAAPECYQNQAVGPRSDIYSCAATLYRMVTGKRPSPAPQRWADESRDCLPAPRKQIRAISRNIESAILDGLALEPANRPASALEFRALLIQASGLTELDSAPARSQSPGRPSGALSRSAPPPAGTPVPHPLQEPEETGPSDSGFFYFCIAAALIVFLVLLVVRLNVLD